MCESKDVNVLSSIQEKLKGQSPTYKHWLANFSKLLVMEIRSHLPQGTGSSALYWREAKLQPYSESN